LNISFKKLAAASSVGPALGKWTVFSLGIFLCWGMMQAPSCLSADRGVVYVKTHDGKNIQLYENSYALVVGNGNYTNGWDPLPGALADVDEVANALKANGFTVELKKDLTESEFKTVFGDFIDTYGSGKDNRNRLLFYYAGHGYTEKLANNEDYGYLVMVDAPDPLRSRARFRRKSITMDFLVGQAKLIRSQHVLFMFDSCFSGTILNMRDNLTPESITDSVKYPVREFITAGRAEESVPDHSTFKQVFLDLLEGRDKEPFADGYITGEELGYYLKNKVPYYNRGQHPQFGKIKDPALDKGDFVFVLKPKQAPIPQPQQEEKKLREPLPLAQQPEPPRPPQKQEETNWQEPTTSLAPGTVFRDTLKDGTKGPEMVVVSAGTFTMGDISGILGIWSDGYKDEKPTHKVTISRNFSIGKYEVTFEEYDQFAKTTGRDLPDDTNWKGESMGRGKRPVINVSWEDAVAYADWLTQQTGKHYRLPTEAEWEYAARRGGKKEKWAGTSDENQLGAYAWYEANSGGKTHPVGEKKPNGLGLYDMSGNVWEWVSDCYHETYEGAPKDGSAWTSGDCGLRVIRGGSWDGRPGSVRSALRYGSSPDTRSDGVGCRFAQDL